MVNQHISTSANRQIENVYEYLILNFLRNVKALVD